MSTKDKLEALKKLRSDANKSFFNAAIDAQNDAYDIYNAADKFYCKAIDASEFVNAARDAAKIDYEAADYALKSARKAANDAEKVMGDADQVVSNADQVMSDAGETK